MKLNQIIALVQGKKTKAQKLLTDVHHGWRKERILGIIRTYAPLEDEGETRPPESKIVQVRVCEVLQGVKRQLADFMNIIATQEYANTAAKANVEVDGKSILDDVPISALLFLDKHLVDLHTLATSLPTLPTDRTWSHDDGKNCWVTAPEKTVATKKQLDVIVKYEATKEHPAQTEMVSLDRTAGHWTTIHLSGALPKKERDAMVGRIEKLRDAVKIAREEANGMAVEVVEDFGPAVLDYIFTSE